MDFDAVQQSFADALGDIDGLRTHPYAEDKVNPPAALVTLENVGYRTDFDGAVTATFGVLLVSDWKGKGLARAQKELTEYLQPTGPRSVREALEGIDPEANGFDSLAVTTTQDGFNEVAFGQTTYLGIRVLVEVIG